jgi:hypothetical protein
MNRSWFDSDRRLGFDQQKLYVVPSEKALMLCADETPGSSAA